MFNLQLNLKNKFILQERLNPGLIGKKGTKEYNYILNY